jgi:urease accessory protein
MGSFSCNLKCKLEQTICLTLIGTEGKANQPNDVGQVALDYNARFLRRKVLALTDGRTVLVDLPQTTSLNQGGVLMLDNGDEVAVVAAPEALLEITADDLTRMAWHIATRHVRSKRVVC